MRIHFTYPLSDTRHYQGEFHVTADVEGHDVDINQILYSDRNGKESNVTYLLEQWGGGLYDNMIEAAVHHTIPESDYTLEMNDKY